MEGEIGLRRFFTRFPDAQLAGEGSRRDTLSLGVGLACRCVWASGDRRVSAGPRDPLTEPVAGHAPDGTGLPLAFSDGRDLNRGTRPGYSWTATGAARFAITMTDSAEVVLRMARLSDRDWEALERFPRRGLHLRGHADRTGRGGPAAPRTSSSGSRSGWIPAGYVNHDGVLVSNGTDVMYEHSGDLELGHQETAVLQFVTVHKVRDGKIVLWKDYWDFGGLATMLRKDWMEAAGARRYELDV